ncbi:MAG: PfkB family carbohydrate kinase [Bradymonadaceae bacterium]
MTGHEEKILSADELARRRETHREAGDTVVQCHGCFDIVHPGHIRYLQFAADQGDVLIVSVTGDESIDKGADRPYVNESLRAENLAALEFVSYVCIDHHRWAGPVLEQLEPDIYVKGKEYEGADDPRFARERELVESYGGKVVFSSGDVVYSSTAIIEDFGDDFGLDRQKIEGYCRRHDLTADGLEACLEGITDQRVLVLGDPILDRYVQCEEKGVASESPMLSVSPVGEQWYPGGGALIARQLATLGADATFLTPLASDADGDRFERELSDAGVDIERVEVDDRPVYEKCRYLVDEQKVFKVDRGRYTPASSRAVDRLTERLGTALPSFDALVATDFGYGLFGPRLVEATANTAETADTPYYVDVSSSGTSSLLAFTGAAGAAPNEEELRFAFGDDESGLSHLAYKYFEQTDADELVLTLGKRGAILFRPPDEDPTGDRSPAEYLPALVDHPVDAVGAGDVFLATLVGSELAGASAAEAVYLSSCTASIHVSRLGNDPVPEPSLRRFLERREELRSSSGRADE